MSNNIFWHNSAVSNKHREELNHHKSACLWFTGLSGSGKSTLANEVDKIFYSKKIHSYILDGDNIRQGLNKDLGFSPSDREENIRRIGETAKLFVDAGLIVLTAFISPYRKDRDFVRGLFDHNKFIEIYVRCDIKTCESRDPKKLYEKARKGLIDNFTGVNAPYEEPENPELIIDNGNDSDILKNAQLVVEYLHSLKLI